MELLAEIFQSFHRPPFLFSQAVTQFNAQSVKSATTHSKTVSKAPWLSGMTGGNYPQTLEGYESKFLLNNKTLHNFE